MTDNPHPEDQDADQLCPHQLMACEFVFRAMPLLSSRSLDPSSHLQRPSSHLGLTAVGIASSLEEPGAFTRASGVIFMWDSSNHISNYLGRHNCTLMSVVFRKLLLLQHTAACVLRQSSR